MGRSKALNPELSARIAPASFFQVWQWSEVFAETKPIELELGAGDGSFLIQHAERHPEINLLGVERLLGRIRKMDRRIHQAQLSNVKLLRIEASYLLKHLIPRGSLKAIHLYFPDPWPKKKHHKNRLVNAWFANQCHRLLIPEGVIHLRTDHASYFEQMLEVFSQSNGFTQTSTPSSLLDLKTDFERGFNAEGIPTLHASYRCAG